VGSQDYIKTQSESYYAEQLDHERTALHSREKGDGAYAPPPHTISIAVNNKCILKCLHCDVGMARRYKKSKNFFYDRGTGDEKKLREIPLDVLKRLVDDVYPFRPVIRPTFLEPLLRKDLFDLADYVKSKDLVFNLQTNGVLLPKKYREIVDLGIDVVRVSLDGPRDIHDWIRGVRGTFDKVVTGLRLIAEYKKEKNVQKPVLGISFTISGVNYKQIVGFFDILQELKILEHVYLSLNFLRFVTYKEADSFNDMISQFAFMTESSVVGTNKDQIDTNYLFKEIQNLLEKYPQKLYQYHFFPSALTKNDMGKWFTSDDFLYPAITCHVPWAHCQILYNGDVVVNGRCCSPAFGNIYEDSFLNIWNSKIAQHFRKMLRKHGNFSVCNRCCRKFPAEIIS